MMPPHLSQEAFSEGDLLLQALHGFFIAVTADGYIFYVSPTVQDYLGFHQSDIIYQSVFELIHTDDRAMFRCQLHWSLNPPSFREAEQDSSSLPENESPLNNGSTMYDLRHPLPENSSFLERSFVCRFRCLLDNSSGFMALDFHGRLKFLYGQNKKAEDGSLMPPQLALFAIALPLQPLSILELRTKIYIFQTKHKLDFTPMACDARGKVLLGYTEAELCMRGSGYQFIHAADMMYCAEKHVRMMKMGESGMTIFRLLTKKAGWLWVQSNARLVYKGGQPDCIIARQRVLSNEEGEEHLHKRATSQLPFNFATGEAVLYENNLSGFLSSLPPKKGLKAKKEAFLDSGPVDPNSLLGAMMQQDESAYVSRTAPAPSFSFPDVMQAPRGWEANDKNGKIIKDETDSLLTVFETLFERTEPESNIFKASQNLDGEAHESQKWEESMFPVNPMEDPSFQGRLQPGVPSCRDEVGFPPESGKLGDFPPLNITTSLQSLRHQAPLRGSSHQTPPMHPFQRLFMNSSNEKDAGHSWEHYWPSVGPDPVVHLPVGLQENLPDLPQQIDGQSREGPLTFGTCSNSMSIPEIQATSGQQIPVFSRQTSWLPRETSLANSTATWPPKCMLASEKVTQPSSGCDVSAQSVQFRPRALGNQWLDPETAGILVPQVPPLGTKPRSRVDSMPLGEPMDVDPQFQTQRAQTNPLGSHGASLWVSSGGPRGMGISDPQRAQGTMSPCYGQQTGPPERHQLTGVCSSYWPTQQRQTTPVTDIYREQGGFSIQPERHLVEGTDRVAVPLDGAARGHHGAPHMGEAGPGVHHQTALGRGASCQRQGMLQSTPSCSAPPPWLRECSLSSPEYHSGLPTGEGALSPRGPPGAPCLGGSSKPAEAPPYCPDRLSSSAPGRAARLERSWSLPAHPLHPPSSHVPALGRPDDRPVSSHGVQRKPSHQKEESSATGFPATVYSPQIQFTSSSEVRSQHPPWD
ncbi:uncharacterized protein LOC141540412 [Sminthopsis crassicaudata]|uniref:uncharacterized protein LOC141540412 n=1 Tax=Sminthopsis crassicaudata TaxID=9301 RepID=UPI003D68A320